MKEQVYLVYPQSTSIRLPEAIFTNKKEALGYTRRFKHNADYTIQKASVNPAFTASKTHSPYRISIESNREMTIQLIKELPYIDMDEVLEEHYNYQPHAIVLYTLAESPMDGLSQAFEICDELIGSGKWSFDDGEPR